MLWKALMNSKNLDRNILHWGWNKNMPMKAKWWSFVLIEGTNKIPTRFITNTQLIWPRDGLINNKIKGLQRVEESWLDWSLHGKRKWRNRGKKGEGCEFLGEHYLNYKVMIGKWHLDQRCRFQSNDIMNQKWRKDTKSEVIFPYKLIRLSIIGNIHMYQQWLVDISKLRERGRESMREEKRESCSNKRGQTQVVFLLHI